MGQGLYVQMSFLVSFGGQHEIILPCHLTFDLEHMLFSYDDFLCLFNVDGNTRFLDF